MIKGDKIYLTTFKEEHLTEYFKLDTDIANRGDYYPLDIDSEVGFKKWFNDTGLWDDNFGRMLICDYNDTILGYINYFKTTIYFQALEIGYIIYDDKNRGRGIATEAVNLFTNYLFKSKNITRLEIRCAVDNIGSSKVAKKCGYIYEGINRHVLRKAGELRNLELYSMTIDDWNSRESE